MKLPHASYRWSVSITEEVKDEVHDEPQSIDSELQKNLGENYEKIDKSDEFVSEGLKLKNVWQ